MRKLPEDWKEVELGEVIEFIMGQAPPSSSYNEEGKGTLFVRAGDFGKPYPIPSSYTTNPLVLGKEGDVFLCVVGATSGKINLGINGAITRSIFALRPKPKILQKFLYYYLKGEYDNLNKSKSGSAQGILNKAGLQNLSIPLPPLPIQQKIVSILEKAEKLKQKREQADKLTKEYLQSVFYEMFLKDKTYEVKTLKEISDVIMGQSPPGESYNEEGKGMPFFQGKAEFTEKHPLVEKWTTKPSKIAEPNSILISVRAPVGTVNLCNVKCCIGRGLASIKPNKEVFLGYLYNWFKINEDKISDLGSGSTFKAITGKQLVNLQIPLPPLPLQQKFAKIVEKTEKLKEKQKQSKENIDEMFNSLMQKAFKGELII